MAGKSEKLQLDEAHRRGFGLPAIEKLHFTKLLVSYRYHPDSPLGRQNDLTRRIWTSAFSALAQCRI